MIQINDVTLNRTEAELVRAMLNYLLHQVKCDESEITEALGQDRGEVIDSLEEFMERTGLNDY